MEEQVKQFVATGFRRMSVAMLAILVLGAVQAFGPNGVNQPTAYGIVGVTLGYYGTKFAEAIKAFLERRK